MVEKSVGRTRGILVDGTPPGESKGSPIPRWGQARISAMRRLLPLVACIVVASATGWPARVQAALAAEPLGQVKALGTPSPHWILYFLFDGTPEFSKYVLFDTDTLEYKAWLTTGYIPSLTPSPDGRVLYVADTFMNGPELRRQDVVSFYDARDFSFSGKIEMPGNRRAMLGPQFRTAVIEDGRYLLVLNFQPGTGISVIDTAERRVVGEIDTPGCTLLYPTGKSGVSMICGDGSLLTLQFDEKGQVAQKSRSEPFFDPNVDPVMENAAAIGGIWYFLSYAGEVHVVDLTGAQPVFRGHWPLDQQLTNTAIKSATVDEKADKGPWRPGGVQYIATHASRGELYVLMHPVAMSGEFGHTFPGTEIWVYDAAARTLKKRIRLKEMMNTVYVTADENPVMVTSGISLLHGDRDSKIPPAQQVMAPISSIQIYNAVSGEFLREAKELGMTYYFSGAPGSGAVQ
ncbi:MAG: amine dehydrogenase large subunit [Dehalococcoidia bacterium]